jgi:hypothetical protein
MPAKSGVKTAGEVWSSLTQEDAQPTRGMRTAITEIRFPDPEEVAARQAREAEWARIRDEQRAAQPDNRAATLAIEVGNLLTRPPHAFNVEVEVRYLLAAVRKLAEAVQYLQQKENSNE